MSTAPGSWSWIKLICAALLSSAAMPARATPALNESELKAAFVYRFAQFTDWPPPPSAEFTYCVAGPGSLQEAMKVLTSKPMGKQAVKLVVLSAPTQVGQCQVLMLSFTERSELQRWQTALSDQPVLVVGDSAEAFRNGAIIGLVVEPNGLAFRVNLSEAKRRGLTLSSQVLKLAREVR